MAVIEGTDQRPVYAKKADVEIAQFAAGGELVREQVRDYFLVAIAGQAMMEKVRNVIMPRDQVEYPIMKPFGEDVWHPVAEYQSLAEGQRVRPTFDQTIFTAKEIMCEVRYPKHALQVQVEEGRFKDTLLTYLGLHTKGGWENLIIQGDTAAGATPFLRMFNGMIAGVTSYSFDALGATLGSSLLRTARFTRPVQYRVEDKQNLGVFCTEETQDGYDEELRNRNTEQSDARLINGESYPAFKNRPVIDVPRWPSAGGQCDALDCNPGRFVFGLREAIGVETEWDPRQRSLSVIMNAWISEGWIFEEMEVKIENLAST
jgi:hypothetical protein